MAGLESTLPFPRPEDYIASLNRKIGAELRARREAVPLSPYALGRLSVHPQQVQEPLKPAHQDRLLARRRHDDRRAFPWLLGCSSDGPYGDVFIGLGHQSIL